MNSIINKVKKIKNIEYIFLILILSLGFFVRLYKIDNPIADWHSFRQADTASVSKIYTENGIDLLYPKYHDVSTTQSGISNLQGHRFVEFPLYNAIHTLLYIKLPIFSFEVWGRLLSIVMSLFSSYLIFLIARKHIGLYGGLLAMLFYLILPFNIFFSRVILPEPFAVTLGLAAIWFFIKYDENNSSASFVASSLFSAMALLVKPYMIFYLVPVVFLAIRKNGFKSALLDKKYWIYALIVVIPLLFWRFWISQYPEGIPFWKWTFNGDGIRFKPAFWKWIFGERLTKLILGYWGLIPFIFGVLSFRKKDSPIYFLLLGMFLYVLVIATANVKHDYYQTLVIPAICITTAGGVLFMWNKNIFGKYKMKLVALFSIFMMIAASFSEIKEFYKINHPEIIEAGNAISSITRKDDLVIAPYYGDTAFLYQTGRRGWPVVDRPIDQLIEKGASFFVSVDLGHYQTREFEEKFETIKKTDNYIILDLKKENI